MNARREITPRGPRVIIELGGEETVIDVAAAFALYDALGRELSGLERGSCPNLSPPWFTGHWKDWHRGHGCDKDDGRPRTPEGAAEIANRS